jgi:hypothetical protein
MEFPMSARFVSRVLAALAGGLLAGSAAAVALLPEEVALLGDGTSARAEPQLSGTVVEERTSRVHFVGWFEEQRRGTVHRRRGNVSGEVVSRVVRAADGTYDFYWQVKLERNAFLPVAGFFVQGFGTVPMSAGWRNDGAEGVSPAYAKHEQGSVGFHFGQFLPPSALILPGQQSVHFFLDTAARAYSSAGTFTLLSEPDGPGNMLQNWGGQSDPLPTFAPVYGRAP